MIESLQNKTVKRIQSLKNKKVRDEEGLFVAEGERFVFSIPDDWEVECYVVAQSYAGIFDKSVLQKRADIIIFSDQVFSSISETINPQGILAVCRQKKFDIDEILNRKNKGFYILAEELNDPGNLGTIIRTADACGVTGIFLSKGSVDLYNPKVLRSTMGSIFHVPILQDVDLSVLVKKMQDRRITVLAAHLQGEQYLYDFDFSVSCGVMVGNEARGLSEDAVALCDDLVKIPMIGEAESLNVSVAASLLMYETVRQRGAYLKS